MERIRCAHSSDVDLECARKETANPEANEHSENATTVISSKLLRLPVRSEYAPHRNAATAQVKDSAEANLLDAYSQAGTLESMFLFTMVKVQQPLRQIVALV